MGETCQLVDGRVVTAFTKVNETSLDTPEVETYPPPMPAPLGRSGSPPKMPSSSSSSSSALGATTSTTGQKGEPSSSKAGDVVDGMDVAVRRDTNSSRRTNGAGLTGKLVDPKRAVDLEQSVGALLAFTAEELAYAKQHPVTISADHNGAPLAAKLTAFLKQQGIPVTDVAAPMAAAAKGEKFPYAQAALPALVGLTNGSAQRVVLICGNGIGMRDVAKQWPGARVSYGEILHEVRSSRKAEDANVLALGARLFGDDVDLANLFLKTFLATPHQGMPERYQTQTDQVQAWARLAVEKGADLDVADFGDAIPAGGTTGTALKLSELMLRRHEGS